MREVVWGRPGAAGAMAKVVRIGAIATAVVVDGGGREGTTFGLGLALDFGGLGGCVTVGAGLAFTLSFDLGVDFGVDFDLALDADGAGS